MFLIERKKVLVVLLILSLIVLYMLGLYWALPYIPLMVCIFFDKELVWADYLLLIVFSLGLMILSLAGIVQFAFFSQALVLYEINENLFFWFSEGNLHAVRFMIAYPAVLISKINALTLNEAFTVYSCMAFALIGFFFLRLLKNTKGLTAFNRGVGLALLIILSLFMNGRLIYAFLGIVLILDAEWKYKKYKKGVVPLKISEITGLILTMVSSGTMTIASVFILFMNGIQWIESKEKRERRKLLAVNILLIYPFVDRFLPYFIRFLIKNIDYYGGGFQGAVGVMQHGFGRFFYTENTNVYFLIVAAALLVVSINMLFFVEYIVRTKNPYLPIMLIANLCIYGGVFGFSTGLLALLPIMALILSVYFRRIKI